VAAALARRVTDSEAVLADTVFHSVRVRVAAGLLRLVRCERGRAPVVLRVTHQEVANLVGSTRETTTLMLHALRGEGLIELGNRRITVVDPEALAHIARPA
jgi:CRP-like cAMP-binding protein